MNFPVTVEVNGAVAVRAKGEGQSAVTELILAGSTTTGEPVRINTNRQYLARAVRLGFDRVHVFSPKTPVLACDDHRSYVWALLEPESAISPAEGAVRIESSASQSPVSNPKPVKKRTTPTVNASPTSPNGSGHATKANRQPRKGTSRKASQQDINSLIEQAEKLRTSLHDLASQAGGLVKALKQHRRQSRAIRNTLDSIRQLKDLGV